MIYFLIKNRIVFAKSILVLLPCLIALLLFSLKVYHNVYPGYYNFTFSGYTNFNWDAFYGNLVSPSRGLLIFSPFLILSIVGIGIFFKKIYRNLLFWVVFISFILHLIKGFITFILKDGTVDLSRLTMKNIFSTGPPLNSSNGFVPSTSWQECGVGGHLKTQPYS